MITWRSANAMGASTRRFHLPVLGSLRLGPLLLGLWILGAASCTTLPPVAPEGVSNPRSLALVCMGDNGPVGMADCDSLAKLRAFIASGSKGSVSIAVPAEPGWVDTDASEPGFTPLYVGGLPQHVVADPADPGHLYLTLGVASDLPAAATTALAVAQVDVQSLALKFVALPFKPAGMVAVQPQGSGSSTLFIADPEAGRIWTLATADFGATSTLLPIEVGGSPRALAWVKTTGQVYVGHLRHNHVTVLSDAGVVVDRISLGPACDDGLDNDGDGKIDAADRGCDDRLDRHEGDPERGAAFCGDSIDNDGDGQIDAADPSCAASPTGDTCRDGVDNDGDGKADYPDDAGCTGFGGDERSDNPSCSDGVDNNGDGKVDLDDSACSAADGDQEAAAVVTDVLAACGDGVDNDGDGLTDLDDKADCATANSGGEARPPCDDGLDDDGDGLVDTADPDCFNRAGAAEVRSDDSPISELTVAPGDAHVLVSHRPRRLLYVIDTATRALLVPVPGAETPFTRPSTLALQAGRLGLGLDLPPLAMAPLTTDEFDGFALTLSMGGLVQVRVLDKGEDADSKSDDKLSIGLVEPDTEVATKGAKPSLLVGAKQIDLGASAPKRYASFGALIVSQQDDDRTSYYGLIMSEDKAEHRTEQWRFRYQGRIPGSERHSGRLRSPGLLRDAHADFCQLGVVPGDWLLLHRGTKAPACGELEGDVVRYRIAQVQATALVLAADGGVVDGAVTVDNQLEFDSTILKSVPLPPLSCVPRSGLHYEVRASQWLVLGSRSGLLSSRGRVGDACLPWSNSEPTQAARLVEPALRAAKDGETVALNVCPPDADDVEKTLRITPYGGGDEQPVTATKNLLFEARLLPGCQDADTAAGKPRLLPSIRDMTWTYSITSGLTPQSVGVGANPVALAVASELGRAFVADQGLGALYIVSLGARIVEEVMQ